MALVQQIDFILGLNQVITLMKGDTKTNSIKLSLGVEEDGRIVMRAWGVIWDGKDMVITAGGDGESTCPVPPDCKNNPACISRVASFVDKNATVQNTFSFL